MNIYDLIYRVEDRITALKDRQSNIPTVAWMVLINAPSSTHWLANGRLVPFLEVEHAKRFRYHSTAQRDASKGPFAQVYTEWEAYQRVIEMNEKILELLKETT